MLLLFVGVFTFFPCGATLRPSAEDEVFRHREMARKDGFVEGLMMTRGGDGSRPEKISPADLLLGLKSRRRR